MTAASILFAVMNALVYQTKVWNPSESPLVASFVRVLVNLVLVIGLAYIPRRSRHSLLGFKGLLGDGRWSLWLRGFFGTLSVITFFYAVYAIGVGETSFLIASNAIWVAILSPFILKQANSKLGWLAIVSGLVGLFFVFQPNFSGAEFFGRSIALLSGFFGACAYLMVSRAGRSNDPLTVVFYFTLVATAFHLMCFCFWTPKWPHEARTWALLILGGISASFAQVFMTKAYQEAPATVISSVSYLTPVANLFFAIILFNELPNSMAIFGSALVLVSGVALPFLQSRSLRNRYEVRQV
ncbi:MAG: DMT family transporter [Proteobacteria bacterium]|nr:DMT family transporter [Pseudomonadota bacterium]